VKEGSRISFIGAGKVSGALCRHLYLSGCRIQKIITRTRENGLPLAAACEASWSPLYDFYDSEELIIVSVPDDNVSEVLAKIKCPPDTLVVHTAGSLGLDIFPAFLKHTGVFYPLQTFTENRRITFKGLPFFIEASDDYSLSILKDLARLAGGVIHFTDTEHRRLLHVAAVFACNFTNHLFTVSKQITEKAGFPFEVLEPLIIETVSKAMKNGPENSQTGPALRADKGTIKKHIDLLSFSPDMQRIYKEITDSITEFYKSHNYDQFQGRSH
jgi:predicted short-subunit dehydrogenase-like oxidoreductase (DUF2520 family)